MPRKFAQFIRTLSLRRLSVALCYTLLTATIVPSGAYAGTKGLELVTGASAWHPTCGLVNKIKAPFAAVIDDIEGLIGLVPMLVLAAIAIGVLAIEFNLGKKAIAYAGKLSGGSIILPVAAAAIIAWVGTTC